MFDLTLSFDNGPEPEVTPLVLDVLRRRNVRASFFVVGHKLAKARSLTERAKAEGHIVGNHTWSHGGPLGARPEADLAEREIGRTQEELGTLADAHRYFRPQGGGGRLGPHLLSREAAALLRRGRYTCVLWNAIPGDWNNAQTWVERAHAQCRERPWTLMVLHDVASGAMLHLDRFIGEALDRGARLRQDFPPDCLPLVDGIATDAFDRYVSGQA